MTALSATERAAWEGFVCAHIALDREIDAALHAAADLSLGAFIVLHHLFHEGDLQQLRLTTIADRTRITISGVSRIAQTLMERKLIERLPDPDDGRAYQVGITEAGQAMLANIDPFVIAKIRSQFLCRFSEEELEIMADFWRRLRQL